MEAEEFEQIYLEKLWKWQRCQWENYADDAKHDLSAVDAEIFRLLASCKDAVEFSGRKAEIFRSILHRELVDRHPDVARLRNRLDAQEFYSEDLPEEQERDQTRYQSLLASKMKPDVLELMRIRDRLARELGFSSYVDLVFSTEDLELEATIGLLEQYLERNLPVARDLVKKPQIAWPDWFSDLDRIGHIAQDLSPALLINEFLDRIGFSQLKDAIPIIWKDGWGYEGVLSVPDDARILVSPIESLRNLLTLFHELGHAATHSLNREEGLFKTWTVAYNESMAVVMEHIAATMLLDRDSYEAAREIFVLESTRLAISALFEFSLWEHPEEAESLYTQHYSRLGVEISAPSLWALDSFRSIDPVYTHSFVIGAVVAEKTIDFLKDRYCDDFRAWGEWLNENYFADGRRRSLKEKTEIIGGLL